MQWVARAAARVGREPDLERTAAAVVEQVVSLGARVAYLHLFDSAGETMVLSAHHGLPGYLLEGVRRIPLTAPRLVAQVAHCRALVAASQTTLDPRLAPTEELLGKLRCSTVVSGPLMARGELIGVLTWFLERPQVFSADEQAALGAGLEVFAGALATARSLQAERALRGRMDALRAGNLSMGSATTVSETLQVLVEQATVLTGAELAAARGEPSALVWFGVPGARSGRARGALGIDPLLRWAATQSAPRRLAGEALRGEPGLILPPDSTLASAIAVPLRLGDRLLATLCVVDSPCESGFSADEERTLALLAQSAALALDHAHTREELAQARAQLEREAARRRRAEALAASGHEAASGAIPQDGDEGG